MGKHGVYGFSFCLYDHTPGASNRPYQASSQHYTSDEREAQLLGAMRAFHASLGGGEGRAAQLVPAPADSAYLRSVASVRPPEFFDIVCRVLAVDDAPAPAPGDGDDPAAAAAAATPLLLHIWDATDALPFSSRWCSPLTAVGSGGGGAELTWVSSAI